MIKSLCYDSLYVNSSVCAADQIIFEFYHFKIASPLRGYKHVVTAEQVYGTIEQVHEHEICHSGVKKVSYSIHCFIDLLFLS